MDKKEILYNFTQDNQANIRFIESKTTIITAIIGGSVKQTVSLAELPPCEAVIQPLCLLQI